MSDVITAAEFYKIQTEADVEHKFRCAAEKLGYLVKGQVRRGGDKLDLLILNPTNGLMMGIEVKNLKYDLEKAQDQALRYREGFGIPCLLHSALDKIAFTLSIIEGCIGLPSTSTIVVASVSDPSPQDITAICEEIDKAINKVIVMPETRRPSGTGGSYPETRCKNYLRMRDLLVENKLDEAEALFTKHRDHFTFRSDVYYPLGKPLLEYFQRFRKKAA